MSTNTKLAAALRLAREWFNHEEAGEGPQAEDVIKAAREALAAHDAEQAQEPIAWQSVGGSIWAHKTREDDRPLYAAPVEQAAQAVPAGFVPWHYASLALNYLAGCGDVAPDALKKAHEMLGPQAAPAPEAQAADTVDAQRWRTFIGLPYATRAEWAANLSMASVLTQWVDEAAKDQINA